MSEKFVFEMRETVRDEITQFAGTITGRVKYATGCRQYLVQPSTTAKERGKYPDAVWIDEDRLIATGRGRARKKAGPGNDGGPQRNEPPRK